MIRLKSLLKEQTTAPLTPDQEAWLDECTSRTVTTKFGVRTPAGARSWSVDQGFVNVEGDFWCWQRGLPDFMGVRFRTVTGGFYCLNNQLTTLEGAPQKVGGIFDCSGNKLTSLKGAPQTVGGDFYCSDNNLTSLEGAPKRVGGNFRCDNNKLTSLKGAPQTVEGGFFCAYNEQLTSLEGAPKTVGGNFVAPETLGTKDEIQTELGYQGSNVSGKIETW